MLTASASSLRQADQPQDQRGLDRLRNHLQETRARLAGQVQSLESMNARLHGPEPKAGNPGNPNVRPTPSGVLGEINEACHDIDMFLEQSYNLIQKLSETI